MNFLRRMQASEDDGRTSYAYEFWLCHMDSPSVPNHNDHIKLPTHPTHTHTRELLPPLFSSCGDLYIVALILAAPPAQYLL